MAERTDILLELFKTLKSASDKAESASMTLTAQQAELVNHIKSLPIDDLKASLEDHKKVSSSEVWTCTERVDTKTGNIMDELKTLKDRVDKMILVVKVAFSIIVISILIGGITTNYLSKKRELKVEPEVIEQAMKKVIDQSISDAMERHEQVQQEQLKKLKEEIDKEIEAKHNEP